MPVAKKIYLAKNFIWTTFHTFPAGFAGTGVYVDELWGGTDPVSSEFHILSFFFVQKYMEQKFWTITIDKK
jgi:hypothetical protein